MCRRSSRSTQQCAYSTATYLACLEFVAISVVGPARLLIAPDELVAKAAAQYREHQGHPADNGSLVIHRHHLRMEDEYPVSPGEFCANFQQEAKEDEEKLNIGVRKRPSGDFITIISTSNTSTSRIISTITTMSISINTRNIIERRQGTSTSGHAPPGLQDGFARLFQPLVLPPNVGSTASRTLQPPKDSSNQRQLNSGTISNMWQDTCGNIRTPFLRPSFAQDENLRGTSHNPWL